MGVTAVSPVCRTEEKRLFVVLGFGDKMTGKTEEFPDPNWRK